MANEATKQPKDSRNYFMLPQAPEEAGYYVYGTPAGGAYQYAHPTMMTILFWVEREWAATEHRKFGVGNISLYDGEKRTEEHRTHINGLQVDIRPVRKDGLHRPVTWRQSEYDAEATAKLIAIFFSHPFVKQVLFNDTRIPRVRHWDKHDDHFHVAIKLGS
jgi:penicillin-insensitive murein DD-endopeptidase